MFKGIESPLVLHVMPITSFIGITILVLINVVLLSAIWISSHVLDPIALINMKVRMFSFAYLFN
jgi:hypothetical protein